MLGSKNVGKHQARVHFFNKLGASPRQTLVPPLVCDVIGWLFRMSAETIHDPILGVRVVKFMPIHHGGLIGRS